MKRRAYTLFAIIVLVGSLAVAAEGQTSGRTRWVAYIPFQFNIGNQTMPAGEYQLLSISSESANAVVKIKSADGKTEAMLHMRAVDGKVDDRARLVFHCYGNRLFFAQAWTGDGAGLVATKSRAERAAERELVATKPKSETVALRNR
jgi:hypothetical protein